VAVAAAVPQLDFAVLGANRLERAAQPTLAFALRIDAGGAAVRSVLLDAQIQIAARRRAYDGAVHERLFELFGPVRDWGTTLRTLLWTRLTAVVPPFSGSTEIALHVPCSYDLEVLASKYLDALDGGDVPLEFLFSGTVFQAGPGGLLQAARISWEQDAEYRLPVSVWRETMEHHFRDTAWLRLRKDRFDRLAAFKASRALPTWEDAVDALLDEA
jgi:hypothetical protein